MFKEVSLEVTGYLRHRCLHAVRRALQHDAGQNSTIGDLAAQYGFWNWSYISQLYDQLFGELPSETRSATQSRS
ncbi:MAG: helix-turn-helix domain-containing protein [Pseudomonadota bacterium]